MHFPYWMSSTSPHKTTKVQRDTNIFQYHCPFFPSESVYKDNVKLAVCFFEAGRHNVLGKISLPSKIMISAEPGFSRFFLLSTTLKRDCIRNIWLHFSMGHFNAGSRLQRALKLPLENPCLTGVYAVPHISFHINSYHAESLWGQASFSKHLTSAGAPTELLTRNDLL